jgi:ATP-dependent DNA ligase
MFTLRVISCLIDGEAVACDDDGLPVFEGLRQRCHDWPAPGLDDTRLS